MPFSMVVWSVRMVRRAATQTSLPLTVIVRSYCASAKHKAEAVKPLAEVKDQVVALVKHNKAAQQAKLDAEKILADLKAGKNDALKAAGLSFGEAKTLSRTGQGSCQPGGVWPEPAGERQTCLWHHDRYAG